MTLKPIIAGFSGLEVYDQRKLDDTYVELVFYSKDSEQWEKILADFLGPAVKAAGDKPSKSDLVLTKDYGRIRREQTLFTKECDDQSIIAMLWPWQDDEFITLKIVVQANV